MGGHGGLNILPQKKWNVYNWDNREIVDKDKLIHEQKLRKQYEDRRDKQLDDKMSMLREQNGIKPDYNQSVEKQSHSLISAEMKKLVDQHKHVNLFQEEERILMNKEVEDAKRLKEELFMKDKNMDYSSRFLGTYNNQSQAPWYSKKKGFVIQKHKNKHFKDLDDVIYGVKSDSKITKEVIQAQKKGGFRQKEDCQRDRTRQKVFKRYQQYEDKYTRLDSRPSRPVKELIQHEEELLLKEFKNDKSSQMDILRQKRLRRQEKEKRRIEELKRKREK